MKTKFIASIFNLSALTLKAQNATAYAYYFVNKDIGSKDVYIFTSPRSFQYVKGSSYVFNPAEFERIARKLIENRLKSYDPSFNGLYVNQLSNGSNTSFKDLKNTNQEIHDKMIRLYQAQQKEQYRPKAVEIVQVDMETGRTLSEYTLAATKLKSPKKGAGNAN